MTTVDTTGAWYCTVEDVEDALNSAGTRRPLNRIRTACADATLWIDRFTNRHRGAFLPIAETRYFAWPQDDYSRGYRLYLGDNTLTARPTSVTSGGVAIAIGDVYAEPIAEGPPYDRLELNIGSTETYSTLATHQRQIAVACDVDSPWGWRADSRPAGALAEALDSSETAVDVTDSTVVGIGTVLRCGNERMTVTGKSWLATGQTVITTALTASKSNTTVLVTDGTAIKTGERLLIDSERMMVVDIAGNTVTVERAIDGSVLAAHIVTSVIYAPRTLTVTRGALGTVNAAHNSGTTLTAHVVEAPIAQLALAEALEDVLQSGTGYAREIKAASAGAGTTIGVGIDGIRERVRRAYRRGPAERKAAI